MYNHVEDSGNRQELYSRCVAAWGYPAQIMQVAEECIELALACHHYLRDNRSSSADAIVEEIADVELMIGQLKHMLYINDNEVAQVKARKVARLEAMLGEE